MTKSSEVRNDTFLHINEAGAVSGATIEKMLNKIANERNMNAWDAQIGERFHMETVHGQFGAVADAG